MRKNLKIDHAQSFESGIRFYSNRHKGYVAIATADEHGVKTEWVKHPKKNKQQKKDEIKNFFSFGLRASPFVIGFELLLEWAYRKNSAYGIRTLLIGVAVLTLITFILNVIYEGKPSDVWRFHSAEHMVLNAYRKLKRVPSMDEIIKYPRYSNSCGTNVVVRIIMNSTLLFVCTFIPNNIFKLIGMLSVIVIVEILFSCGLLNFLQKFTTMTPTKSHLEVAIRGLETWVENEGKE